MEGWWTKRDGKTLKIEHIRIWKQEELSNHLIFSSKATPRIEDKEQTLIQEAQFDTKAICHCQYLFKEHMQVRVAPADSNKHLPWAQAHVITEAQGTYLLEVTPRRLSWRAIRDNPIHFDQPKFQYSSTRWREIVMFIGQVDSIWSQVVRQVPGNCQRKAEIKCKAKYQIILTNTNHRFADLSPEAYWNNFR